MPDNLIVARAVVTGVTMQCVFDGAGYRIQIENLFQWKEFFF